MKEKILYFVIGLLVGAILATGVFYIYERTTATKHETTRMQAGHMRGDEKNSITNQNANNTNGKKDGAPPSMPSQNGENSNNGTTPPQIPSNDNNGTPPAMPTQNSNAQQTTSTSNS